MEALNARKRNIRIELGQLQSERAALTAQQSGASAKIAALQRDRTFSEGQVAALRKQERQEDHAWIQRGGAKYLTSAETLDAGTLTLYWNRLEFRGWRGNATIPLKEITSVRSGHSGLSRWAGIPLVERWLPRVAIQANTLLLDLTIADGTAARAVIAGLRDSTWSSAIEGSKASLEEAVTARSHSTQVQQLSLKKKATLDAEIESAEKFLSGTANRIRRIEAQIEQLENELSLPDWEHKTLQLSGRNLSGQLDRALKSETAYGWELVSTASPRKDEMVVTLKRLRPL